MMKAKDGRTYDEKFAWLMKTVADLQERVAALEKASKGDEKSEVKPERGGKKSHAA